MPTSIKVVRDIALPHATLGQVFLDYGRGEGWQPFAFACEDRDRGLTSEMTDAEVRAIKIPAETAIPTGTYQMSWHRRGDGSLAPMLDGVPGYRWILIHAGNDLADTAGCILMGMQRDEKAGTISKSRVAINWLYDHLHKAGLGTCTIERAPGLVLP